MSEVKLFGTWYSPFSYRVVWALKLKGIEYEHVEENLADKSDLLLQYNPVHKKIPVLVHAGKPIAESMVILEYIEETWPGYPLLPTDPYERSVARFWVKYLEDKSAALGSLLTSTEEKKEKAIKEWLDFLQPVEDHALGQKKFFGGDTIGLADLAFGVVAHWLGVIEKVVEVKVFDADRFPLLHAWMENFKGAPVIKENLPDPDEMFAYTKKRRETLMAMASRSN